MYMIVNLIELNYLFIFIYLFIYLTFFTLFL